MTLESKTGRQLEQMIADLAGSDEKNIVVSAAANQGSFTADLSTRQQASASLEPS